VSEREGKRERERKKEREQGIERAREQERKGEKERARERGYILGIYPLCLGILQREPESPRGLIERHTTECTRDTPPSAHLH